MAWLNPDFINFLIACILVLIMYGVGLTLTQSNFKAMVKQPKPFFIGLSAQMLMLPLLAFAFCFLPKIPTEWKIGLFVLSICPGGVTSNFISYLLKGNSELSVSLTTANSILALISIPLSCIFIGYHFANTQTDQISVGNMIGQLLLTTSVPAAAGIFTKYYFPKIALVIQASFHLKWLAKNYTVSYLKLVTILLLGIMFTVKLFASEKTGGISITLSELKVLLPLMLAFNISTLLLGYSVSKCFKLGQTDTMTIGIEVGLQNTTLAFLVIGNIIQSSAIQQPALVYALFSFWTALLFGLVMRARA